MRPGEVVSARYRLEAQIGRGGFGSVFRALDLATGVAVAVKFLHHELHSGVAFQRFEREAQIARSLGHPSSVRLLDAGEHDGARYLVFELLMGESLRDHLRARGRIAVERTIAIAAQVLEALSEAHALGIVHRDIKPANVFLCDGDRVKVLDFGIAKPTSNAVTALTDTGVTLGSPAYMAPEQASGGVVSPRTDLYALGITMVHMIAGEPPYRGGAMDVLLGHLSADPVPLPPAVTESALGGVVLHATQKDPSRRPASALEMLYQLRGLVSVRPSAPAVPDVIEREARRGWLLVGAACFAALLLMAVGITATMLVGGPTASVSGERPPLVRPPGFAHAEIRARLVAAGWTIVSDNPTDDKYYANSQFELSGGGRQARLSVDFHRGPAAHTNVRVGSMWASKGSVSVDVWSTDDDPLVAETQRRVVTVVLGPKPDSVRVSPR